MTLNKYQELAGRTERPWSKAEDINGYPVIYHTLKLNGEAGEVADTIGKTITGKVPTEPAVAEELGDALWHLARLAHHLGFTLEEIAQRNLDKLSARHGATFRSDFYTGGPEINAI